MLVTTEKDIARLTGDPHLTELAARVSALPVRLVIDEQEQFQHMVLEVLKRRETGL